MKRVNPFTAAPEGVAVLTKVEDYVRTSGLEPRLLALVRTRVSQMNGCAYCLHMHTEEALQAGEQEVRLHVLDAWRESAMYSERERAALNWAESLTNIAETHAPDAAYEQARGQFSDKELAELSIAIAIINSWNRLAIGSRATHPADKRRAA